MSNKIKATSSGKLISLDWKRRDLLFWHFILH